MAAALSHVVLSLLLGAVLIGVGLRFRTAVQGHENLVVGGLLLATGATLLILELLRKGHGHGHDHAHDHDHDHDHGHGHDHSHDHDHGARRGRRDVMALVVPFGVAASPDLTILPVFLAASASGVGTAVGSLVVFASVTVATIVGLTLLAAVGARTLTSAWADQGANLLAAVVLLAIGGLVTTGII
jgi:ABC-type nickel/cobalt efflux system permease component RcnA